MRCTIIIPSAGVGERYGEKIPKQYCELNNIPVLIRTLLTIDMVDEIDNMIIPIDPEWQSFIDSKLIKHKIRKQVIFVKGGKHRLDSVYNALLLDEAINSNIIIVHDAVRPAATPELFFRIIEATQEYDAAIPIVKLKDTIKVIDKDGFVNKTLSRDTLRAIQTPQGFKSDILVKAYKNAISNNIFANDDAELVEKLGIKVKAIDGEPYNIKLTEPTDKIILEHYFEQLMQ